MKQAQYSPMSVSEMALTLFAVNKGYMDDVEVNKILAFESALTTFVKSKAGVAMEAVETAGNMDDASEKAITAACDEFKKTGVY
jgi:F-type H+-transporting ATPase subunit alpha